MNQNTFEIRDNRLQSASFYVLLATVVLSPIIFWPSSFIALETVKTAVIALGTIIGILLFGISVIKEKRVNLPPRRIFWTSVLLVISLVVSALMSAHVGKSLFGQGFETNTVSFIALMFVACLLTFFAVSRKIERSIVLYVGMIVSFLIIYIFHALRIIFGADFASFGIFQTKTVSLLGNWLDFGTLSIIVSIISLCAILFLPLSKRMRIVYWILIVISVFAAFIVGNGYAWMTAFLVMLGFTVFLSVYRIRSKGYNFSGYIKNLAWIPLVACIFAGIMMFSIDVISAPVSRALDVSHSAVSLSWPATLDVTAGSLKQSPLFGIGTNHFIQAYLQHKPDDINYSDGWGIEFAYGFSLMATLIAEQGLVGFVLWTLFFIFIGIMGREVMRNLNMESEDKSIQRFILISSYLGSVLLWVMTLITVPSHVLLFFTFILTGIFIATSVNTEVLKSYSIGSQNDKRARIFVVSMTVVLIIVILWGIISVKKVVALSYFGRGVKALTSENQPDLALASFTKAYNADHLDVYLQGKAESRLAQAVVLANQASEAANSGNASSSEALIAQLSTVIGDALLDARAVIAFDESDYVNYLSEARVSEAAVNLKMQNAYETAKAAHVNAIRLNPKNPSLYLNLARLEISQNKLDDAIKAIGAAIQVKPNYLDAIFILSQVYVAKGDLNNAIIAAKFATELNPQNPLSFLQLGLLQYNSRDYTSAAKAFETAIKLQPDYANAQYFLGLSYARLGKTSDAIEQFTQLSKTNPENNEVKTILENLKIGKSIFNDPQIVDSPEKKPTPPIKTPAKTK